MTRVAAIGEAMIELSIKGDDAHVGVAGDTLNTAIYLKRAAPGVQIDYVTCLGDDPFSDQIESFVQSQEIGTSGIRRLKGKSPGLYAITTTAAGERSFTYWRNASAARSLFEEPDGYNFEFLANYDLLYLSGISVAILPHPARLALLDWLKATPVKMAYDSNFRPKLWESTEIARTVTNAFWERADICLPSLDDEMALYACSAKDVPARFAQMAKMGALKQGDMGPLSLGTTVEQEYPAAKVVVDTTAAGDSFNGGYLAALLTGKSQSEALMAGHQCAAEVVGHRGAIIPRRHS